MRTIEKNNEDFRFGLSSFSMAMNKYGDLVSKIEDRLHHKWAGSNIV